MTNTRVLALSRAPKHRTDGEMRAAAREWNLRGGTRATMLGALALQIGVSAAAGEYPLFGGGFVRGGDRDLDGQVGGERRDGGEDR